MSPARALAATAIFVIYTACEDALLELLHKLDNQSCLPDHEGKSKAELAAFEIVRQAQRRAAEDLGVVAQQLADNVLPGNMGRAVSRTL